MLPIFLLFSSCIGAIVDPIVFSCLKLGEWKNEKSKGKLALLSLLAGQSPYRQPLKQNFSLKINSIK